MINKLFVFFSVFFLLSANLSAQRLLFEEDLRGDTLVSEFGMNRKHYIHGYMGFHFPVGAGENADAAVAFGRSWSFEYGQRYKRKWSNTFSSGIDAVLKRSSFHPEMYLVSEIPDEYEYNREKFVFLSFGLGIWQRINFNNRGNYIGRFVDFGAYGDLHYNVRHILKLEGENDNLRIRRSDMEIHEIYSYGLMARIGLNNFVLKASYRLSDIFKPGYNLPEFTRFKIGLELGLHPL